MIQFTDTIKLRNLTKKTYYNKIKLFYQYKGIKFYVDMSKHKNYIEIYMHNNRDLNLPEYFELYSSSINMNGFKKNIKSKNNNSISLYNYIVMMFSYLVLMKNESKNKLFIKKFRK
jgi:hypothetical protein